MIPTRPTLSTPRRAAPDSAGNERATWLTGAALATGVIMIASMLAVIVWHGAATFWPRPVERVTLAGGEVFLGIEVEREAFALPEQAEPSTAAALRARFLVGNRDLGQPSFRWVDIDDIASRAAADDAVLLERDAWGAFIGVPRAVIERDEAGAEVRTPVDPAALASVVHEARARAAALRRLTRVELPRLENEAATLRWRARGIERSAAGHDASAGRGLPVPVWLAVAGAGLGMLGVVAASVARRAGSRRPAWRLVLGAAGLVCVVAATVEHPWSGRGMDPARAADRLAAIAARTSEIDAGRRVLLDEITQRRAEDERIRIEVVDPASGRIAPAGLSTPQEPMVASRVLRVVRGGNLGFMQRVGIYLARWADYLTLPPGEEPGSGGVWPVILGTVSLTLLLTVVAVPLGVVAALYLREYARQGVVVSVVRIAINNLAGVPSIVYGMFGLGFFCYSVGGFVDGGPGVSAPRGVWWGVVAGLTALVGLAGALAAWARSTEGPLRRIGGWLTALLWLLAALAAAWLIARTPYFSGVFADKLPEQPTFGGKGILWAAVTLALLTLPVVIVATEEAISAVPNSMREGSYGCGASKWQTVRRIVLPSALPGIMTGAILAMARGAGEVAPLMLVGAVNLSPAPPVSAEFPFLHGERTFMHLGFHIYNLGFQSPDAAATEPLVWTTTLLLVAIVLVLNLTAVVIRARLRRRAGGML